MLIELNVTPSASGRHSGGGGTAAPVALDPGNRGGPSLELPAPQSQGHPVLGAGVVLEPQVQERLSVTDKRLRQAMYSSA